MAITITIDVNGDEHVFSPSTENAQKIIAALEPLQEEGETMLQVFVRWLKSAVASLDHKHRKSAAVAAEPRNEDILE